MTEYIPFQAAARVLYFDRLPTASGAHPACWSMATVFYLHYGELMGRASRLSVGQRLRMRGSIPPVPHTSPCLLLN
jgi:hypothetical protein